MKKGFAIPSFNCTSSCSVNACLAAGAAIKSPIMIQVSQGGAAFFTGKTVPDKDLSASICGSIACALHTRQVAPMYGIPVILHSDHCAKKLLPWFDGMLKADEEYFAKNGEPLFSSHMLDLSEETNEENIGICAEYFKRMKPMNMILEMEIGITGGAEDGVDNSGVAKDKLYTTNEDVWQVYQGLSPISEKFTVAAAFGNVHGVYKPGNVVLRPELLGEFQAFVKSKLGTDDPHPVVLVQHGGSGSEKEHIKTAVSHGVCKMNVDTDTQWAFWIGLKDFYESKKDYLQGQIGNPEGADKPNKAFYDPRKWLHEAEKTMTARVGESCTDLGNVGTL